MTLAGQLAVICSAAVVVLAAIAATARYLGGKLVRLGRQWHGIQLAVKEAAEATARLADQQRTQLVELTARKDEEHSRLAGDIGRVDERLHEHEQWHAQWTARSW